MFQIIREPDFAKRLTDCRTKLGLRQTDCAAALGVTRQLWSHWEIGYCKPQAKRIKRLAVLLNCDPFWLQHGDDTELSKRIANVTRLMRIVMRDLDHIQRALGKAPLSPVP